MKLHTTRLAALTTFVLLASVLAMSACSDDNGDSNKRQSDAPANGGPGSTIAVVLTDFAFSTEDGSQEFRVSAGDVTFDVRNDGSTVHELAILRTDLDAGILPSPDGILVDEEEAGEILARTSLMNASAEGTVTANLAAGEYVFLCNVAGHYDSGMFADLVVE